MRTFKFKCLRCGECCRSLVKEVDGMLLGPFLMPEETRLFSRHLIYPQFAYGVKGRSRPRPETVISYQIGVGECPHLNKADNMCKIYEDRPLSCRAFPIEVTPIGIIIDRNCKYVRQALSEGERVDRLYLTDEVKTSLMIKNYIEGYASTSSSYWIFNLGDRKWHRTALSVILHIAKHYV